MPCIVDCNIYKILDFCTYRLHPVLGYTGMCIMTNHFITNKCPDSNSGIYIFITVFCTLVSGASDSAQQIKNIFQAAPNTLDIENNPANIVKIPKGVSITCTTTLPIYRTVFHVGLFIWGFYELFKNECVYENFHNSYFFQITIFFLALCCANTVRFFIEIFKRFSRFFLSLTR